MKRDLIHSFVLVFVFLLAVGVVFYYSDVKFTGYDVSEETTETTEETTSESTDTTETTTETTEETTTETTEETTTESTDTTETTETTEESFTELSSETCTPSWTCGDWDTCSSGTQIRACTDANNCGSQEGIPETTQSCTYCGDGTCQSDENCSSCYNDCGVCTVEETTSVDTSNDEEEEETDTEIPSATFVPRKICTPSWTCEDWQECIDSVQIRVCIDTNNCGSQEGIPETTQACIVEIIENCSDGIKNQDEEDIDCGGSCETNCNKGFFSLVGGVVSGSVEVGRKFIFEEMFGNVTRMIISIGSMALLIGGFIAARFFIGRKSGKKKLDKAIDNLSGNKDSNLAPKGDPKVEYYY